jgi:membrane protein DedA with SNARE-associated domain
MDNSTTTYLISWVIAHGYFLFFVAAFFEGPLVTAAAGVAAALGYYSIWIILLLSVLGDLSADTVYYAIGYLGGRPLINKYGKYVGLTKERMDTIQHLLHRHARKTIFIVKLSPIIPVPGILAIGSARVPVRKFIETSLLITLPKSLLFGMVGYLSGKAYTKLSVFVVHSQYIMWGIVAVAILVYVAYQKITARFSKGIN